MILLTKSCVHLCKFTIPSTVAVLAGLIVTWYQMGKDCDESVEEKAKRLTWKQKRRQRPKMQPLPHEVRGKINEYERAAASEPIKGCLEKQPYPHVQWGAWTSLPSWNSFNTLSHPSHILLHMADRSKSTSTPTKSNAHIACQFKCHAREAYTANTYT